MKTKVVLKKVDFSKEDFLRAVIVKIASNPRSARNIIDEVVFGDIKENYLDALMITCVVDTSYKCSIGYKISGDYIGNWQPYSGHADGESVRFEYNISNESSFGRSGLSDRFEMEDLFGSVKKVEDLVEINETTEVNEEALERASYGASYSVISRDAPGDDIRDLRYDKEADIKQVLCIRQTTYELVVTHNDVEYEFSAKANGKKLEVKASQMPVATNASGKAIAPNQKNKNLMIMGWVIAGIAFVASVILDTILYQLLYLWSLLTMAGIGVGVLFTVLYIKSKRDANVKLKASEKQKRIDSCNSYLISKGLNPLSADELQLFK